MNKTRPSAFTEEMERTWLLNAEALLRFFTLLGAISSACIIGNGGETKEIFPSIERKATYTDLPAFTILVIVEAVVAVYHFIQLCKCAVFLRLLQNPSESPAKVAWVCYILDQTMAYVSFAAVSAATQASMLSVAGMNKFQWVKLCDIFASFCLKVNAGLLCALGATALAAAVAAISAVYLFRRYSPSCFLSLKE